MQNGSALAVDHVQSIFCFITDVHARPVGRKVNAVGSLHASYHLNDAVGRGINHIDGVTGAVGDIDQRSRRRAGASGGILHAAHPFRQRKPVGIVLRAKLSASGMKGVAARFGSKRMHQDSAGFRISWRDVLQYILKVEPRLRFRPTGASRKQLLEMKRAPWFRMTGITARMTRPRLQKDRLDVGPIKLEIKGSPCYGMSHNCWGC